MATVPFVITSEAVNLPNQTDYMILKPGTDREAILTCMRNGWHIVSVYAGEITMVKY